MALLALVVLAAASGAGHEHALDAQRTGHTDCDACHFRHLSVIQTGDISVPPAPDRVAQATVSGRSHGQQAATADIHPTRGPPA